MADQFEAAAEATSVVDLFERLSPAPWRELSESPDSVFLMQLMKWD
jgi:hypothetical protein